MSRYTIRTATSRDLVAVQGLIGRGPMLSEADITRPQRGTWQRMMATPDLTVYLAESGSVAVGTTASLVMPHLTYDCRPTMFIESMYVRDDHRRRGVARAMVERVLADAQRLGCFKIQLLAHKRHAADGAHDFYRAMGFVAEAEGFRRYLND